MSEKQTITKVLDDRLLYARLAEYEAEDGESRSLDIPAFLQELRAMPQFSSLSDSEIPPEHPTRTVELEGQAVGDSLVLTAPEGVALPFTLAGDTIILGDYRIVLRWKGSASPARP